MEIVDVISVAKLTTKHVVVNWGTVFEVKRNGVFVTATFKVDNWDLKSGRSYRMEHKETWHESHEVCVFVDEPGSVEQLRELKARGLRFGEIVQVYAEDNTKSQRPLIEKARHELQREGELEFDDSVIVSGGDIGRGAYVMCWVWVEDDENTVNFKATFTPQAWISNDAVSVDAEGARTWDATEFVRMNWDLYFKDLFAIGLAVTVVDDDDMLKGDPNAPEWIRNWPGPFMIEVEAV